MPLIIKGDKQPTVISKKEMANKMGKLADEKGKDELSHLSHEMQEKRREILEAKRHREFMAKIAKQEEEAMAKLRDAEVVATEELVVDNGPDPIIIHNDIVTVSTTSEEIEDPKETPDFDKMTKKELDEWAEETLGLALDRRKKKADLIEIIKNNL